MSLLAGAVIAFDLDGTLVDTAPDLVAALNAVLTEQGLPPVPFEDARVMVGHGAKRLIEKGYAATGLPLSDELSPRLVERFVEVYRAHIADHSRPFDGLIAALDHLSARGAILSVCTNKRTDLSVALLEALDLTSRFASVVGADKAPAAKPDARHLLCAIEQAGGDPARAVMVGDSSTDVGAAKNAGVPCIVVSFGYTDVAARDLGAEAVIDSYADLVETVENLLGGDRS